MLTFLYVVAGLLAVSAGILICISLLDDIPFVLRKCVSCGLRGCTQTDMVSLFDLPDKCDCVRICLNCGARAVPGETGDWIHIPPDNRTFVETSRQHFGLGIRWLSPVRLIWRWTRGSSNA